VIAQGPVASQEIVKFLGTNGGGFFNANSAHPFENPTALTNLIEMAAMFLIGVALTNVFGRMVGNESQGWAILAAMGVFYIVGVTVCYSAETAGNPQFAALGIGQAASITQAGGNMEGKEVRFGIANSALFTVTTDALCGAVNTMHDSLTPIGKKSSRQRHSLYRAWEQPRLGLALERFDAVGDRDPALRALHPDEGAWPKPTGVIKRAGFN